MMPKSGEYEFLDKTSNVYLGIPLWISMVMGLSQYQFSNSLTAYARKLVDGLKLNISKS